MALLMITLYSNWKPFLDDDADLLSLSGQITIFLTLFATLLIKLRDPKTLMIADGVLVFVNFIPTLVFGIQALNTAFGPILKLLRHIRRFKKSGVSGLVASAGASSEDDMVAAGKEAVSSSVGMPPINLESMSSFRVKKVIC